MTSKTKTRKIVIIGCAGVGKSSLVSRLTGGVFSTSYSPTVDTNHTTSVDVDRLHSYQIQLLDTAGLDELSEFPGSYALSVDAYILVYSVTSKESFTALQNIYRSLLHTSGLPSGRFPVILVANKTDQKHRRVVDEAAGWALAARWQATYIETSAKVGCNMGRLLQLLAARLKDADEGRYLMSTCRRKPRQWWRRLSCASRTSRDVA